MGTRKLHLLIDNPDGLMSGFGGAKRDRTADLLHAMQALSQLSYGPDVAENEMIAGLFLARKPFLQKFFHISPLPVRTASASPHYDDRNAPTSMLRIFPLRISASGCKLFFRLLRAKPTDASIAADAHLRPACSRDTRAAATGFQVCRSPWRELPGNALCRPHAWNQDGDTRGPPHTNPRTACTRCTGAQASPRTTARIQAWPSKIFLKASPRCLQASAGGPCQGLCQGWTEARLHTLQPLGQPRA